MNFDLIVASDENNGIGLFKNDEFKLPWHNKDDMLFFKNITSNDHILKAIIMGKNTFSSLNYKPLANRFNIIISSTLSCPESNFLKIFTKIDDALLFCKKLNLKTFVIGGSQLYAEALTSPYLNKIYWNIIHQTSNDSNIYFPLNINNLNNKFYIKESKKINDVTYNILLNKYKNDNENNYLELLEKIENDSRGKMNFGKHKGKKFSEINLSYFESLIHYNIISEYKNPEIFDYLKKNL